MKKVNKIMAVFILICVVMSYMPFNIFAVENQEEYTQICLNGATSVETDSKTVTYENGSMTVNDPNAILVNNEGTCFLYTQLEDLSVSINANEGFHIGGVAVNGNHEGVEGDTYTLTGLVKNTNVNFEPEYIEDGEPFVERAEIELRGAIAVNSQTGEITYDNASVTVAGEGMEFKVDNRFDEQIQSNVSVYFLYTTGNSLTFTLNGEYENNPSLLINGARENFVDNNYILDGLNQSSRIIIELDVGGNNNNNNNEPGEMLEIQFDNAVINGNVLTFNVNGKGVTAEVVGATISEDRIEVARNDLYNIQFVLSDNYDNEEMQVIVRGDNNYQGLLNIEENNIATFNGLFVGDGLHFTIEPKAGGNFPGDFRESAPAPALEEGYLVLSMINNEHASGIVNYYFVDAQNMYLRPDGSVINEQKQPAGQISSEDEIRKVAIPENAVKVLLGIDEGNATEAGPLELYVNDGEPQQLNKDDMKYGRTIEVPYNSGDMIGLGISWNFWVPEEEFYPEEKGTYLITHFMNNEDAIVKYKDENNEEQILDSSKDRQAVRIARNVSLIVPDNRGHIQFDIYDENMNLISGDEINIAELLRYGEGDLDTYYDDWMMSLNDTEYATLDLSSIDEDYTVVVSVHLIDPTNEYQAHVLTWTNMRGSGWGDDALIDGGFARLVKAYDAEGNLIWDANEEYPEENYMIDEMTGERTNKFVYGEPMEYIWERGPMYEFAISQDEYGGEVEAVEGVQLVMEFTPVYGKQLVEVSLGDNYGDAEGSARYYKLVMPANHVHFSAKFEDVNNEAVLAENISVSSVEYQLDEDALNSGTAVLSVNGVEDLTNEQRDSFAEVAGEDYEVTDYLNVDLKQVWFKGVNAEFDNQLGYSDEQVWSENIYDLGDKNATITVTLDDGNSPDDVIILHELHDEDTILGYEAVNITNKEKNEDGVWTVTFETSKFSNYAIASKLSDTSEKYTVSFDTDGGTEIEPQEVISGQNAYYPETNPTKEGYIFDGWCQDPLGTVYFDFWDTPITQDTTVYARWVEIQGEINDINLSVKAPQIGDKIELNEYGGPSDIPNVRILDEESNYVCGSGWIKGTYQEVGEGYDELFEGTFEEDTYYYAGIEIYANEGYVINPDVNITVNGEAPAEVSEINNGTSIRFIVKMQSIPKLPTYEVSFDTDGGTEIESQFIESGEMAYYPETNPTKEGYIFDGWYEDPFGNVEFSFWDTPITQDTTVYARWIEIQGEINDINLSVKAPQIGNKVELNEYSEPSEAPSVRILDEEANYGYGTAWIKGTYQEVGEGYDELFEGTFEEDTYYYAGIEIYADWGYVINQDVNITINGEAPAEVSEINNGTSIRFIVKMQSIPKLPTYEVSFDTDGGTEVESQFIESGEMAYYPEQEPVKEGYIFDGWCQDPLGTVYFDFWDTPITQDTTVYAKWVEIIGSVEEINVTVKAPQIGATVSANIDEWGNIEIDNPPNVGNSYDTDYYSYGRAWFTEPFTEEEDPTDKLFSGTFEEDTYYYAVITTYIPREGYILDENTNILVNGEEPVEVFSIEDQTHVTFIAKIKSIPKLPTYEVSFDTGVGPEVEPQFIESGEMAEYPDPGEREGYLFAGWYEDPMYTVEFEFWNTPITQDTTVYGKWVEIIGEVNSIELTIQAPKVGDTVEIDEIGEGGYGEIVPSITPSVVVGGVHYKVDATAWVIANEDGEVEDYFSGTFEEGNTYTAAVLLETEEGYVLNHNDLVASINGLQEGKIYPMFSETFVMILADIEAVPDSGAQEEPEPPVHVHELALVDAVAPTCETSGHKAYYKCDECGKYYEDETATVEITNLETMNLAALGHDWNEWVVVKEPTAVETGLKERTCKNNPSHKDQQELAKIAVKVEAEEKVEELAEVDKIVDIAEEAINAVIAGDNVAGINEELKAEILAAANSGKTIKIDLAVSEVDEDAIAADAEKVEAAMPDEANIGKYYDIDILLKVDGVVKGNITELLDDIEIELPIPTDLPEVADGCMREYIVYRVHNGVVTPLKTVVKNGNAVIKTNQFSTYALTYTDVVVTTNSNNPKTSDNIMLYVAALGISVLAVSGITYSKKNKKVQK